MKPVHLVRLTMLMSALVACRATAVEIPNPSQPISAPDGGASLSARSPMDPMPAGLLRIAGGESKAAKVKATEGEAHFTFWVTNACRESIKVSAAFGSCGCMVAKMPATPWTLPPGGSGPIDVTMKTAGKHGTVSKVVTMQTDHGTKTLQVQAEIIEASASAPAAPPSATPSVE